MHLVKTYSSTTSLNHNKVAVQIYTESLLLALVFNTGPRPHEALGAIHSQCIHHHHQRCRRNPQVAIPDKSPRPHRQIEYEHHWKHSEHGARCAVRIDKVYVIFFEGEMGQGDSDKVAGEAEERRVVVVYYEAHCQAEDAESCLYVEDHF